MSVPRAASELLESEHVEHMGWGSAEQLQLDSLEQQLQLAVLDQQPKPVVEPERTDATLQPSVAAPLPPSMRLDQQLKPVVEPDRAHATSQPSVAAPLPPSMRSVPSDACPVSGSPHPGSAGDAIKSNVLTTQTSGTSKDKSHKGVVEPIAEPRDTEEVSPLVRSASSAPARVVRPKLATLARLVSAANLQSLSDRVDPHSVRIEGLPRELAMDEAALRVIVSQFGQLESLQVHVVEGHYKSWCVVTFVQGESAALRLLAEAVPVPREPGCERAAEPIMITNLETEMAKQKARSRRRGALQGLAKTYDELKEEKQRALCHVGPGAIAFVRHGRRLVAALLTVGGHELHLLGGESWHRSRHSGAQDSTRVEVTAEQLPAAAVGARSEIMELLKPKLIPELRQRGLGWEDVTQQLAYLPAEALLESLADPQALVLQLIGPRKLVSLSTAKHDIACFGIDSAADIVYTTGMAGDMVAWNFKNGTQRWRVQHHTKEITALSIVRNVVCTGSQDESVCAVDKDTGSLLWCFDCNGMSRSLAQSTSFAASSWQYRNSIFKVRRDTECAQRPRKETIAHAEKASQSMIYIAGIQGSLAFEERLADVFGRLGRVVAVTLRHRLDFQNNGLSYALLSFSCADEAKAALSNTHFQELTGVEITRLDIQTLQNSTGLMGDVYRQHREQLEHVARHTTAASHTAVVSEAVAAGTLVIAARPPRLSVAVSDGVVYVGSGDTSLHAIRASDGVAQWLNTEHFAGIRALCVSAGCVYSGGADATVRATEAATGVQRWSFTGHVGGVTSLCISGPLLFSGSWDGTVRAIDVTSGQQQWVSRASTSGVIAVSAASGFVFAGSNDGSVRALGETTGDEHWCAHDETTHRETPHVEGACACSSVSVTDDMVYCGSLDRNTAHVRAINAATGAQRWQLGWQDQSISSLSTGAKDVYTAVGTSVYATDCTNGKLRWRFDGHHKRVQQCIADKLYSQTYTCSDDATLRAIDMRTGEQVWSFEGHNSGIRALCSQNGVVFSASSDCTVRAVHALTGQELWCFDGHTKPVAFLAVCQGYVFTAAWDKTVCAVDAFTGQQYWRLLEWQGQIAAICAAPTVAMQRNRRRNYDQLKPQGRSLMSASSSSSATKLIQSRDRNIAEIENRQVTVFISCGDKTVRAIDAPTGEPRWCCEPHSSHVSLLHVDQDGSAYAVAQERLAVIDTSDGTVEFCRGFPSRPVSIATDHGRIFIGFNDGCVEVVDRSLETIVCANVKHTTAVNHLILSDGKLHSASTRAVLTRLKPLVEKRLVMSAPLNELESSIRRFMGLRKPELDLYARAVLMVYTTLQLATFAFNTTIIGAKSELHVQLLWIRDLGFSAEGLFNIMLVGAFILTLLFLLVIAFKQRLELARFTHPDTWVEKAWFGMTVFCQAISTFLFVPICRTLARTGDCTWDESTQRFWLDASLPWDSSPGDAGTLECFRDKHWVYLVPGLVLFVLFVGCSVRLIRVDGHIQNVEIKRNPFDWSCDAKQAMPYGNELSPRSSRHATMTAVVKCIAVLSSTFLGTTQPVAVAVIMLVASFMLFILTLTTPPFFGPDADSDGRYNLSVGHVLTSRANRLRCALDLGTVCNFACGLAATLDSHDGADISFWIAPVLPASVAVCLLAGYGLPTCLVRGGVRVHESK